MKSCVNVYQDVEEKGFRLNCVRDSLGFCMLLLWRVWGEGLRSSVVHEHNSSLSLNFGPTAIHRQLPVYYDCEEEAS